MATEKARGFYGARDTLTERRGYSVALPSDFGQTSQSTLISLTPDKGVVGSAQRSEFVSSRRK